MVVPETSINNIMGGLESTGGVTLHTHRRKLKQRFDIIKKLGQGTYGKVQLGVNKETGQEVAIKTIKKCKIETEADLIRIRREIQIMSSLRHPYIIHIYEVFENKDKMVLVMEYAAGGELYDYLSERKVLQENEARRIFRQISMAVYYCHKHQICHRDLKLENILLDEEGNAKIADFGLSNVFDSNRLLSTFCGSPLYASPEIVKGIPYHGPEVDCWSLGVLLYTLVYGTMPFDGSNFKRLVRQISQGEYYEPKTPSNASKLIRALLTVKGSERVDITGVCKNLWLNEGEESCMELAKEFSSQTPVRLDLLLALAPQTDQITAPVPEEVIPEPEKPMRSQSLGSLAATSAPPVFSPQTKPDPKVEVAKVSEPVEPKKKEKKVRERSTSRSRKKDSDTEAEKPKKRIVKKKKAEKDNSISESNDEIAKLVEDAKKITESVHSEEPKADEEAHHFVAQLPASETSVEEEPPISVTLPPPPARKDDQITDQANKTSEERPHQTEQKEILSETVVPVEQPPKPADNLIRRKSKVFETAEMFSKPLQEKVVPKKVYIPGVKVSDARAAFERRSSLSGNEKKPEFNLASTVHLDRLVQSELRKDEPSVKDEERVKKENAVKVISNAIEGEKKASTLPRRKPSRPDIKPATPTTPKAEPEHMVANTKVSQVVYPVPAPRPSLVKQESVPPRERIIPIRIEEREEEMTPPQTPQHLQHHHTTTLPKQNSISSKTSSTSSLGRQDSDSSSGEPIRKSPREVIIPIAVEGGGYVTPSQSTLQRISSVTEGDEEPPFKGFGLRSTRRRVQLDTADSLSSDEDDDNFEIITAENLFSTLLSRVRSLTQRLNDDETRPNFPRFFNHSLFDNHSRRLSETRSFSQADPTPWRRKRDSASSLNSSSSTLPRDFTTKSLRRLLSQEGISSARRSESMKSSEKPPVYQRKFTRTVSDSVRPTYVNGQTDLKTQDVKRPPFVAKSETSKNKTKECLVKKDLTESSPKRKISSPASLGPTKSAEAEGRTSKKSSEYEKEIPKSEKKTKFSERLDKLLMDSEEDNNNKLDELVLKSKLSSIDRVKKYLEEIHKSLDEEETSYKAKVRVPESTKSPIRSQSLNYDSILSKYPRPRTVYVPNYSLTSEFDRYLEFKRSSLPDSRSYGTLRRSQIPRLHSYESTSYRREPSEPLDAAEKSECGQFVDGEEDNVCVDEKPTGKSGKSILEKYGLSGGPILENKEKPQKASRFLRPGFYSNGLNNKSEKSSQEICATSRIDKAIKSLRKNSVGQADDFSESKLLKRAVSLEDLKVSSPTRNRRASSLKPSELNPEEKIFKKKTEKHVKITKKGGVFDSLQSKVSKEEEEKPSESKENGHIGKENGDAVETLENKNEKIENTESILRKSQSLETRQMKLLNLKLLEFSKPGPSTDSTPTGDFDEVISQTDNSDTWSSSDYTDNRHCLDFVGGGGEECVSERIRRKSYFTRFNQPSTLRKFNRSQSTSGGFERKKYL